MNINKTEIKKIGGEFALIDRLSTIIPRSHVDLIVGMGDDAAVIRTSPEPAPYLLVTTDILVENHHFKCQWADARQIGVKAAECNISDIAAMGGRPTWMFISLVLAPSTTVEWTGALYDGIAAACRRHGVTVAGGDTTKGSVNTINITQLGTVYQDRLCLRSHAKTGDRLMVTGTLGASAAAFHLLEHGRTPTPYLSDKHLAPRCRLDASEEIAPLANAMIDISDGLGSEVHHICRQSGVSAELYAKSIPLHDDVRTAARQLGMDPVDLALSGGEDFELLFTVAPEKVAALKKTGLTLHEVGVVTEGMEGPVLVTAQGKRTLEGGFDHFE